MIGGGNDLQRARNDERLLAMVGAITFVLIGLSILFLLTFLIYLIAPITVSP